MALYCFFSKSFVKILGTRQIGNHSAIIGPRVTAKEDPKAIRAKSVHPCSWKNDLPGQHDLEGRKENLDLPVSVLTKWRITSLVVHGPVRG